MIVGLFGFLFAMWILILIGGGIVVVLLGPITISGYGQFDWIISSGIKAIVSIILVSVWILVLLKIKNWIFRKAINS
jgi:hypothetical protein